MLESTIAAQKAPVHQSIPDAYNHCQIARDEEAPRAGMYTLRRGTRYRTILPFAHSAFLLWAFQASCNRSRFRSIILTALSKSLRVNVRPARAISILGSNQIFASPESLCEPFPTWI